MTIYSKAGSDPHQQAQIYGDDGRTLAVTYSDEGGAFAARVVACVKACEGWNDPGNMRRIFDRDVPCIPNLKRQRDGMADILGRILRAHESGNNGAYMGEAVLCEGFAVMARAALAGVQS